MSPVTACYESVNGTEEILNPSRLTSDNGWTLSKFLSFAHELRDLEVFLLCLKIVLDLAHPDEFLIQVTFNVNL